MRDPLGIVLERFELVKVIEFEKKIGGHGVISQFFPGTVPGPLRVENGWSGRNEPYARAADPYKKKCTSRRSRAAMSRSPLSCCRVHRSFGAQAPARVKDFTRQELAHETARPQPKPSTPTRIGQPSEKPD
jgi:hypothetical protein